MLDGILPAGSALGESGGWPGPACHSELQLHVDTQDMDGLAFGRGLPTGGKGQDQRQTRRASTSINFFSVRTCSRCCSILLPACVSFLHLCITADTCLWAAGAELHSDKESQKYLGV